MQRFRRRRSLQMFASVHAPSPTTSTRTAPSRHAPFSTRNAPPHSPSGASLARNRDICTVLFKTGSNPSDTSVVSLGVVFPLMRAAHGSAIYAIGNRERPGPSFRCRDAAHRHDNLRPRRPALGHRWRRAGGTCLEGGASDGRRQPATFDCRRGSRRQGILFRHRGGCHPDLPPAADPVVFSDARGRSQMVYGIAFIGKLLRHGCSKAEQGGIRRRPGGSANTRPWSGSGACYVRRSSRSGVRRQARPSRNAAAREW